MDLVSDNASLSSASSASDSDKNSLSNYLPAASRQTRSSADTQRLDRSLKVAMTSSFLSRVVPLHLWYLSLINALCYLSFTHHD